jgi:hypothetical protein
MDVVVSTRIVKYSCDDCGREWETEDEANGCARQDEGGRELEKKNKLWDRAAPAKCCDGLATHTFECTAGFHMATGIPGSVDSKS